MLRICIVILAFACFFTRERSDARNFMAVSSRYTAAYGVLFPISAPIVLKGRSFGGFRSCKWASYAPQRPLAVVEPLGSESPSWVTSDPQLAV